VLDCGLLAVALCSMPAPTARTLWAATPLGRRSYLFGLDVIGGQLEPDRDAAGYLAHPVGEIREVANRSQVLEDRRRDRVLAFRQATHGVAIANSAIQAVGCVAARMCNTNNCSAGIAAQKPDLRARLDVQAGAERLAQFLHASVELM
jgi:hypothetical protein